VSCLVVFFVLLAATGVKAQNAPAPPANSWQSAPPPPQQPPPPNQWGYPAPPSYGYGYGNGYGYGPNPQTMMLYESQKKIPGIALLLEVFVPGVGSIYADHATGAFITWGLTVAGFVLIMAAFQEAWDNDLNAQDTSSGFNENAIWLGLGLMLGGRVYGLFDSYSSAKDYNAALAQRLGLGPMHVSLAPIRMGGVTAWGPALSFRF
jgi:hypothetical protein